MLIHQILTEKKDVILEQLNEPNKLFTFLNPVSYLIARKNPQLYLRFDFKLADGWLFVAALRMLFKLKIERHSFDMTSIAPIVFKKAIENNQSVYFIGAKANEIDSFIRLIKKHYPNLNIIGFRNGYFRSSEERNSSIKNLINLSPEIVIAGLGVPLQEEYLVDLRNYGWNGCGYTCGGFIHQTTKNLYYYPNWVNKLHFRMLYRFYKEPAFRTRIPAYFKFLIVFLNDFLKFKFSNTKFK